jgi:hypothetical protein
VEGALWLYPNSSSDARIAIGRLKLNRQIVFILHIPLKSSFYGEVIEQKIVCRNPKCKKPITIYWYSPLNYFNRI